MRKLLVSGFVLLACCSVSKSPETRVADRLRECDVISAGKLESDVDSDETRCALACFENASCNELNTSYCGGEEREPTPYEDCVARCFGGGGGEPESLFECDNGDRVPEDFACDGEDDCADGSDEEDCADKIFSCDNGELVPKDYACDGEEDCEDGSDEENCPDSLFFVCDDGGRVPKSWVCDLEWDCEDGSDEEQGCAKLLCGE